MTHHSQRAEEVWLRSQLEPTDTPGYGNASRARLATVHKHSPVIELQQPLPTTTKEEDWLHWEAYLKSHGIQ